MIILCPIFSHYFRHFPNFNLLFNTSFTPLSDYTVHICSSSPTVTLLANIY